MGISGTLIVTSLTEQLWVLGEYEGSKLQTGARFLHSLQAASPMSLERTAGSVAQEPDSMGHT